MTNGSKSEQLEYEFVAGPVPVVAVQEMDREGDEADKVMVGAGILGGVLGCFVCGPVMACVAGVGCAYGTTQPSHAGDAARSMGHLALSCRSKAIEIDEKHHLVQKARTAACTCWKTSKTFVDEHQVVERTGSCLSGTWGGIKKMNQDYRIVDRSWQGLASTMNMVNDKISATNTQNNEPGTEGYSDEPAGEVLRERGVPVSGTYSAVPGVDNQVEK